MPLFKQMMRYKALTGFKIACSGRLSRRGRASHYVRSRGKNPLSKITAFVSYAFRSVVLKNSVCGIKVWLFYDRNNAHPYQSAIVNNRTYFAIF